jgi:hypothetical protein
METAKKSNFFKNSIGTGCSKKVCIFSKFFEASFLILGINFWIAKKGPRNLLLDIYTLDF